MVGLGEREGEERVTKVAVCGRRVSSMTSHQ